MDSCLSGVENVPPRSCGMNAARDLQFEEGRDAAEPAPALRSEVVVPDQHVAPVIGESAADVGNPTTAGNVEDQVVPFAARGEVVAV